MRNKSKTNKRVLPQEIKPRTHIARLNDLLPMMVVDKKAKIMGEILLLGNRRATVLFVFDAVPSAVSSTLIEIGV